MNALKRSEGLWQAIQKVEARFSRCKQTVGGGGGRISSITRERLLTAQLSHRRYAVCRLVWSTRTAGDWGAPDTDVGEFLVKQKT
jgi:hypothetical protein